MNPFTILVYLIKEPLTLILCLPVDATIHFKLHILYTVINNIDTNLLWGI